MVICMTMKKGRDTITMISMLMVVSNGLLLKSVLQDYILTVITAMVITAMMLANLVTSLSWEMA